MGLSFCLIFCWFVEEEFLSLLLTRWRRFELALSWFGGLDGLDVAMMDFLSHGPAVSLS